MNSKLKTIFPKKIPLTWKSVICAFLGIFVTYIYLTNEFRLAPKAQSLSWFMNLFILPAYLLAGLISGNMHAPNEFVTYSILFTIYLIMAMCLLGFWNVTIRWIGRKRT